MTTRRSFLRNLLLATVAGLSVTRFGAFDRVGEPVPRKLATGVLWANPSVPSAGRRFR
jgi:hypothetical protein